MSLTDSSPEQIAKAASVASTSLAILPSNQRNGALTAIHRSLSQAKESILAANAHDVAHASQAAADGELSPSILKRLDLSRPGKWDEMLQGILDVRELEDPGWYPPRSYPIQTLIGCTAGLDEALHHSELRNEL